MSKAEETVPDRQARLPDRAHAADDRPGRGRRAVARDGQKRLETPHLTVSYQPPRRIDILAQMILD